MLLVSLPCCWKGDAAQTVVVVSSDGNDKNRGTIKAPFKSVNRAKQALANLNGDITIYLREGTHYLDTTIVWMADEKHSESKITIKSYPGERACISGAKPLKLKWTPYQKGIMQASVKDAPTVFDQLVVDGKLQRMARYPNFDANAVRFGGVSADATSPEMVATWSNPEGGYMHASHRRDVGSMHSRL